MLSSHICESKLSTATTSSRVQQSTGTPRDLAKTIENINDASHPAGAAPKGKQPCSTLAAVWVFTELRLSTSNAYVPICN